MPNALPQWTEIVAPPKSGRDHLGLGSVSSELILSKLLPAVNVLTMHARNYAFYAFALDEFWRVQREHSPVPAEWSSWIREREFIYSVATHLCPRHETHHVGMPSAIGSRKTEGLALRLDEFDTAHDFMKSRYGGYGLYYAVVMQSLGLVYRPGPGKVDIIQRRGQELAAAFRAAVENTEYYRDYFRTVEPVTVPKKVVAEYAEVACLCRLAESGAPDRPVLRDIFLREGLVDGEASQRRGTFRMMLDIVDKSAGVAIRESTFRELLYYGQTPDSSIVWSPRKDLTDTADAWRLYQLREYCSFALNAMWKHVCQWGVDNRGEQYPLPMDDLWEHVESCLTADAFAAPELSLAVHGLSADLPWIELERAVIEEHGGADPGSGFDSACAPSSPLSESALVRIATAAGAGANVTVPAMLTLLAVASLRFADAPGRYAELWGTYGRAGGTYRKSAHYLLLESLRIASAERSIGDVARWLFEECVILQHQLIAMSKLPDNTFRFRFEGAGLRFHELDNPLHFGASRFDALTNVLRGLGMMSFVGADGHALLPDGRVLLEDGDL